MARRKNLEVQDRWHEKQLETLLEEAKKVRGNSLWKDGMKRFKKNRVARISFWGLLALAVLCWLTPLLPLAPYGRVDLKNQYLSPNEGPFSRHGWTIKDYSGDFFIDARIMMSIRASVFGDWELGPWMGTDSKGRCLMSRILWGGRVSLIVGLVATLVSLIVGVTYGALSGLLGGRWDNLMMRAVDIMYSIPFIFVVIFLITVIRANRDALEALGITQITVFFAVIGLIYWLTMARVVRGQVLSLKNKEFIEAAHAVGASTTRVLFRHVVPNVFSVVLVYLTLTIPRVMLFEAFLSFLGLGVEPPDVSWGMLAADGLGAITPIRVYWWFVLFPALALGLTLLALNFLGDGLRDALDPRLRDT